MATKNPKKKLPVVCFSGEFSSRKDDALFEHSGVIVLDFDHVDVAETKQALGTDDYVLACWTSPSGDGVKALVRVTNPERHRDHFRAMSEVLRTQVCVGGRPIRINESRACFESFDPDIVIKEGQKFGSFLSEKAESGQVIEREGIVTDYMKLNLALESFVWHKTGRSTRPSILHPACVVDSYPLDVWKRKRSCAY